MVRLILYAKVRILKINIFQDPIPEDKIKEEKTAAPVEKELTEDDFLPPELKAMMEKSDVKDEVSTILFVKI